MNTKPGMGGSRCGKGRRDKTGVLKANSTKLRRRDDSSAIREQYPDCFQFGSRSSLELWFAWLPADARRQYQLVHLEGDMYGVKAW